MRCRDETDCRLQRLQYALFGLAFLMSIVTVIRFWELGVVLGWWGA